MYRITVYEETGKKTVISEDEDVDDVHYEARIAIDDLCSGNLKSVIISKITGKAGIRDDL